LPNVPMSGAATDPFGGIPCPAARPPSPLHWPPLHSPAASCPPPPPPATGERCREVRVRGQQGTRRDRPPRTPTATGARTASAPRAAPHGHPARA
jgi:hypothetical protein